MKSSVEGLIIGERATEIDKADSPDGSTHENSGRVVVIEAPEPGEERLGAAPAEVTARAPTATTTARARLVVLMEIPVGSVGRRHVPQTGLAAATRR
jgi:hypothetical protein